MSLHNRHLVDRSYIHYDKGYIREGFKRLSKLIKIKSPGRAPYKEIVDRFTGAKKKQYYNAMINLAQGGFHPAKHTLVKMFVKPDRWPEQLVRSRYPRAIQFRSKEYNLLLASYLHPVEADIYKYLEWNGTRVVAKGLTARQRAELWMQKCSNYSRPWYYNIDHSKFDSTVNRYHLKHLHRIYEKVCGKGIRHVVKYQMFNRGYAQDIRYRSQATRCSGDFDTGLGNTLINVACILQCFSHVKKFDFLLDGDDAIVVSDTKVDVTGFEKFGFETVLSSTKNMHEVEFCQSRLVDAYGWTFVRNPIRAISNTMIINKRYGMKYMARYLSGVGLGELSVSKGVPILQQQALRLMESSDFPVLSEDVKWQMEALGTEPKPMPVTMRARTTLALSWGISVPMQHCLEKMLLPLTLKYARGNVRIFSYDIKSLYRSWERMASVGCTCASGRWEFGWGSANSVLPPPYHLPESTTAADCRRAGTKPRFKSRRV